MSSVDPSQLPALVTQMGYPLLLPAYAAEPTVRQSVFRTITATPDQLGFTGRVMVGATVPRETGYGRPSDSRTMDEGYQWYGRSRKFSEDIVIPEEMYRSPNAMALIRQKLDLQVGGFGAGFQVAKEQVAANVFIYGAYTAGHRATFDGSYPGHTDPYPKFIYDGKPLFAASGNGHPLYLDTSVTKYNKTANALTSTNLDAARILMEDTNAVDEANQKIRIDPTLLLIPPALAQTAQVLLGSVQAPGSANNDINTMRGRFALQTWRYLSDADGWFLGVPNKGLVFADTGDPYIETGAPDPKTGDVTIRFLSYCAAWVEDWRYWSGHNISES